MWMNTLQNAATAALNIVVDEDVSFDPGHLDGLRLSRISASTVRAVIGTHPLTAKLPHNSASGNYADITVTSNLDCVINGPNGIGALDVGVVLANTDYELWLGAQTGGTNAGLMFVKHGAVAVWPAGYDWRRMLVILHNGAGVPLLDIFTDITTAAYLEE